MILLIIYHKLLSVILIYSKFLWNQILIDDYLQNYFKLFY
jgi:hypothetical protein